MDADGDEFNASIEFEIRKENGEAKGDCKIKEADEKVDESKFKMDAGDDDFNVTVAVDLWKEYTEKT